MISQQLLALPRGQAEGRARTACHRSSLIISHLMVLPDWIGAESISCGPGEGLETTSTGEPRASAILCCQGAFRRNPAEISSASLKNSSSEELLKGRSGRGYGIRAPAPARFVLAQLRVVLAQPSAYIETENQTDLGSPRINSADFIEAMENQALTAISERRRESLFLSCSARGAKLPTRRSHPLFVHTYPSPVTRTCAVV